MSTPDPHCNSSALPITRDVQTETEHKGSGLSFIVRIVPASNKLVEKVSMDPFNALPAELIIGILEQTRSPGTSRPSDTHIMFPLRFVRVCRRWRFIVLATPKLWKDVYISGTKDIRTLAATGLFMERSRPYPMTLTWHHRPWNHEFVVQHILSPGFDRWRVITIASSTSTSRALICTTLPNLFLPSLQDLRCKSPLRSHMALTADEVPEVVINAPNLRQWASINCMLPSAHSFVCLATLDFSASGPSGCFSVDGFLALLRATSRLRHLRLVARDPPFGNLALGTPKTRLSKLEVMELHNSSGLLQWILTPNLQTLCLHGDKETTTIPFSTLLQPTLVHLKLSMLPLHHFEDDPDFSFHFSSLETIVLFSCKDTASVFSHAIPRRPGRPPFPSLRSITLSDAEALPSIRFMLERSKVSDLNASSLRRVRLVYRGGPSPRPGDVEWIVAQGIEFLGGRELGESWSDSAFDDGWAV